MLYIDRHSSDYICRGREKDHQQVHFTLALRGQDPDIREFFDKTALMTAAANGELDHLQTLLELGALTDLKDFKGLTALMKAVDKGHRPCIQTLLEHGALIDLQDGFDGNTALMKAAMHNQPEIIGELLARQADVNIVNNEGKTALQLAEELEEPSENAVRMLKAVTD